MNIEKYILEKDINVICMEAKTFPEGITEAFQKINSCVPSSSGRRYFGLSRPDEGGTIIYKAAIEENFSGEAETLNFESFTVKSGEYASILIPDFMQNLLEIGNAFKKLTSLQEIESEGYCLEMYLNAKDVLCMIPLKSNCSKEKKNFIIYEVN